VDALAGMDPGAMVLLGVATLAGLAAVSGLVLAWLDRRLPATPDTAEVERINRLLPGIQCGQCGYPGCRPYAEALLAGTAPTDRCPPGGEPLRLALDGLLNRAGPGGPPAAPVLGPPWTAAMALIDEEVCVGCARCIEVCPVDAILGAARHTHTVLAADCTGCELCIPACPVDCISLVPAPGPGGMPAGAGRPIPLGATRPGEARMP
jgi:electron transport complex protein RnfB